MNHADDGSFPLVEGGCHMTNSDSSWRVLGLHSKGLAPFVAHIEK
ncbi:hypothetical protein B005_2238 [Nocardiopsis alba ATCC BAA-2165]|uniref:Uncharacterized protein n=1 Tax=Nocardiopsis alba (strain ATCC BAA-2165 / BE74) TaxID=1205910 RepID=J7L6F9_NOCAA|nr:hypothetical protein B005_2238 [Nocardiopsis alba ATCC BAA-2165]